MTHDAAPNGYIMTAVEGRLGVITLNRPAAINALSLEMIREITRQLTQWRDADEVRAVLFEGNGPKGFCSGGDVRAVRQAVVDGEIERGMAYFAEEYAMNGLIAAYGKPVAALCDGIVMGGGIGIAGHADFRFTTTNVRFAMPESAIGFICDVGSNAILARAPAHRALLFMMSGTAVGAADALALGLTDCAIAAERLSDVRNAIVSAAATGSPEKALVGVMQNEGIDPGDPVLCVEADLAETELGLPGAAEIVDAITDLAGAVPHLRRTAQVLQRRSPTSLSGIVQAQRAARRLNDLEAILAMELRLARYFGQRSDFAEGVRAVLIDKQPESARWSPSGFADVPHGAIAAEIAAVEAEWTRRRRGAVSTS